jgi:hypothetical protein
MSNPASAPPSEDWAFEHARASLRIGLKVQEIEQRLVARGLSSDAATSVVTKALENRIHEENEPRERARRRLLLHRILSGLLIGAYVIIAYWNKGLGFAFYAIGGLLLPFACIWFADELGSATGFISFMRPYITFPTPPFFLRLGGWLLLLIPWIIALSVWTYRFFSMLLAGFFSLSL